MYGPWLEKVRVLQNFLGCSVEFDEGPTGAVPVGRCQSVVLAPDGFTNHQPSRFNAHINSLASLRHAAQLSCLFYWSSFYHHHPLPIANFSLPAARLAVVAAKSVHGVAQMAAARSALASAGRATNEAVSFAAWLR